MSVLGERLADLEYAAAWRLVRMLPQRVALHAFRFGADTATLRDGRGPRQLRANLARAVPERELDAVVAAGMRSYARYWFEAFRLQAMDPTLIHDRTDPHVTGSAPLFEALDEGRGVVFALPHSGNWDAAGVWLVEALRRRGLDPSFTTVGQRLRPESLYRRFVAYRESLGFEVVAAEDGAAAYRALTRRLRSGGVVCLLADRDLTAAGVDVTFLDEPATLPAGPARLAALTGALLLPAYPHFVGDAWGVAMAEPVPVAGREEIEKATQGLADATGELISARPQDWHALQPIWGSA
jgi:phosphatidylinositol dimannoside acyltransferase